MVDLLQEARKVVAEDLKTPLTAEKVLKLGAHLAQVVNRIENLKGAEKSALVCETVTKVLEELEKAGGEQKPGSTGLDCSTNWTELRGLVQTVLPTTLTLIVGAARGNIDLQKGAAAAAAVAVEVAPVVASWCTSCLPVAWRSTAVGLVNLAVAAAAAPAAAAQAPEPKAPLSQPTPIPPVEVEPPKESESREAAEASQESAPLPSTVEEPQSVEENRP